MKDAKNKVMAKLPKTGGNPVVVPVAVPADPTSATTVVQVPGGIDQPNIAASDVSRLGIPAQPDLPINQLGIPPR